MESSKTVTSNQHLQGNFDAETCRCWFVVSLRNFFKIQMNHLRILEDVADPSKVVEKAPENIMSPNRKRDGVKAFIQ